MSNTLGIDTHDGTCRRSRSEDVEMQMRAVQQPHKPGAGVGHSTLEHTHEDLMLDLFAIHDHELLQYLCIGAFKQYIESCFEPLIADEFVALWASINQPRPTLATECWPLFHNICSVSRTLDEESTIDDVWAALASVPVSCARRSTAQTPSECSIAVFSLLCWVTMTLQPKLLWPDFKTSPQLRTHRYPLGKIGLPMHFVTRPIPAVFRQVRRLMPTTRWRHPIGGSTTNGTSAALEVSCLNFSTLKVVGKISLVWVSDLASHLDFDATKRQLCIFRFPSFCALSAVAGTDALLTAPVIEG